MKEVRMEVVEEVGMDVEKDEGGEKVRVEDEG